MENFIHSSTFRSLPLVKKVQYLSLSQFYRALVAPSIIEYDPLGIGRITELDESMRTFLRTAREQKEDEAFVQSQVAHDAMLDMVFDRVGKPARSFQTHVYTSLDKLRVLLGDYTTPDSLAQASIGLRGERIKDVTGQILNMKSHIDPTSRADLSYLTKSPLRMWGATHLVEATNGLELPAGSVGFSFFGTKDESQAFGKAARKLGKARQLYGRNTLSPSEKQQLFNEADLRDLTRSSFVYTGTSLEALMGINEDVHNIEGSEDFSFLFGIKHRKNDYQSNKKRLGRLKWTLTPVDDSINPAATALLAHEHVFTDLYHAIRTDFLGRRQHGQYSRDRLYQFMHGTNTVKYDSPFVEHNLFFSTVRL